VGPTARVSALLLLPEDGRRSSFRNVVILLKYRRWTMPKKTAVTGYSIASSTLFINGLNIVLCLLLLLFIFCGIV
jgi:hypothetical protein